ncbi:MAG: NUDIX hydrolase [Desulfotignum sp.]|nr:NUDIX hydrolase [Desulfotignum sp.]
MTANREIEREQPMGVKYCSVCGAKMTTRIPEDDDHARPVCDRCGHVHYENPKLVVGCIPVQGDQVLLCKRNIEPQKGMWTLPAGYLENGETVQQGAVRETLEETRSRVAIIAPYRMFNLVFVQQIYLMFRARLLDDHFGPTKESTQVRLFSESEIPWEKIAFESIRQTLADYFSDRPGQEYPFEIKQILPSKKHADPA